MLSQCKKESLGINLNQRLALDYTLFCLLVAVSYFFFLHSFVDASRLEINWKIGNDRKRRMELLGHGRAFGQQTCKLYQHQQKNLACPDPNAYTRQFFMLISE